jgi:thiol-disulfide isomerase/thioredoxin
MQHVRMSALACAALAVPFFVAEAQEPRKGSLELGSRPSYTFKSEALGAAGVKSLADLAGKPVLVDFWGVNCGPCIGFAVPKGVEMQRHFSDDVQVIFVECQGHDIPKVERFAYERGWMGSNAMWTTERPFDVGLDGIPHFALLDIEGKVILQGYTSDLHSQLEEAVAAQVELVQKGPKDLHKDLKGAWKARTKGEYAKAVEEARKAEAKGAPGVEAFIASVNAAAEAKLRRIESMVANGHANSAADAVSALAKGVAGLEGIAERVNTLAASLASAEMKSELEASKLVEKLEAILAEEGLDVQGVDKKLEKIAEKFAGTKAADRAKHLMGLVAVG